MTPTPTIPKPKDSGVREDFSTGSRRDTRKGKGRYDLLPTRALELIALHFENGSEKYGDRNWEKGQPLSRYLDSALRHGFKHLRGLRDEPHEIAAAWNLLGLIETAALIREGRLPAELDDLPPMLIESIQTARNSGDYTATEDTSGPVYVGQPIEEQPSAKKIDCEFSLCAQYHELRDQISNFHCQGQQAPDAVYARFYHLSDVLFSAA